MCRDFGISLIQLSPSSLVLDHIAILVKLGRLHWNSMNARPNRDKSGKTYFSKQQATQQDKQTSTNWTNDSSCRSNPFLVWRARQDKLFEIQGLPVTSVPRGWYFLAYEGRRLKQNRYYTDENRSNNLFGKFI